MLINLTLSKEKLGLLNSKLQNVLSDKSFFLYLEALDSRKSNNVSYGKGFESQNISSPSGGAGD